MIETAHMSNLRLLAFGISVFEPNNAWILEFLERMASQNRLEILMIAIYHSPHEAASLDLWFGLTTELFLWSLDEFKAVQHEGARRRILTIGSVNFYIFFVLVIHI